MAVCMTAALELSRWSRIKSRQSLLYRRPQPVLTHTHIRHVWEHAAYLPRLVECGITFHVAMILKAVLSYCSQATAPISQTNDFFSGVFTRTTLVLPVFWSCDRFKPIRYLLWTTAPIRGRGHGSWAWVTWSVANKNQDNCVGWTQDSKSVDQWTVRERERKQWKAIQ